MMDSLENSTEHLKEHQSFSNFSKKNLTGENTSYLILWSQYYPYTKTRQRHKETTDQLSLMNTDVNHPQQNTSQQNSAAY